MTCEPSVTYIGKIYEYPEVGFKPPLDGQEDGKNNAAALPQNHPASISQKNYENFSQQS